MKNSIEALKYKMSFLGLAMFNAVCAMAQDGGGSGGDGASQGGSVTVSKTTTSTSSSVSNDWYTEPWAIIVGVAVFLLLLVAIIGGSRNRSTAGRTDVRKTTVTREDYRGTDA